MLGPLWIVYRRFYAPPECKQKPQRTIVVRSENRRMFVDLPFSSVGELHDTLFRGETSVTAIVDRYLDRIDSLNSAVNAWITLDADAALAQARVMDNSGWSLAEKPLLGVPVGIKDTTPTRDHRTTYGSPAFLDHQPGFDAIWVERLKAAGAVVLGKTSTPEFAAGGHTENPIIGPTRNPYDQSATVGGSSGGSAAAVSSGMCLLADGTDYGGSLRIPAAFCGVLGLRTTPGVVPAAPAENLWEEVSVPGPIAGSVGDLRRMLQVMAGPDHRAPGASIRTLSPTARDTDASKSARIAVYSGRGLIPIDPSIEEAQHRLVGALADAGFHVTECELDFDGIEEVIATLRPYQKALSYGGLIDKGVSIIHAGLAEDVEYGLGLKVDEVARAQRLRSRIYEQVSSIWESHDCLLMPTVPCLPFAIAEGPPMQINRVQFSHYSQWMLLTQAISMMEWPALSLPAGVSGPGAVAPSMQLVGPGGSDFKLLEIAQALERVRDDAEL